MKAGDHYRGRSSQGASSWLSIKSVRLVLTLFLLLGTCSLALADKEITNSAAEVVDVQESSVKDDTEVNLNADVSAAPVTKEVTNEEIAQIAELDTQLKAGTITQEEYDKQKQNILAVPVQEASALRVGEVIDPTAQTLGKYIAPQVSATDGSLNYEYPIVVPPGRNNLTPDLKLAYNSSNKSLSSVIATGWSFNIPYIQRVNKKGTDQIYTQNDFLSSLDGELVSQGSGIYKPRTENGIFLKYQYINNIWIVTDKSGKKYVFGSTTQARQDDPGNSAKIFNWMLESITDSNGNSISYTYYKDQGQIYPDNIKYNQENTFEIRFNRTAGAYANFSYFAAFQVKTAYAVNRIDIFVNGVQSSKYDINSSNTQLDTITLTGYEASTSASLPATVFTYASSSSTWNSIADQTVTSGDVRSRLLIDINGDGLTDVVNSFRGAGNLPAAVTNTTYINTGSGFVASSTYALPTSYWLNSQSYGTNIAIADMNGDGLPDLISSPSGSNLRSIYLNNGNGWSTSVYGQITYNNTYLPNTQLLVDVNGDGLTDAVSAYYVQATGPQNATYLNTDSGFTYSSSFTLPSSYSLNGESGTVPNITLADINGDGLLDLVNIPSGSNVSQVSFAFLNNGNGWDSTEWVVDTSALGIPTPLPPDRNLIEINGDGMTDVVNSACTTFGGSASNATYIYSGTSYTSSGQHTLPSTACISSTNANENASLSDMNGDGLVDIVNAPSGGTVAASNIYFNKGTVLSTLASVTTSEGGIFKVNYINAAVQDQSNKSPTLNQVVESLVTNDLNGVIATTSYVYKNGTYYFNNILDRRFAGFGEITKTNADGSKITTKYHQANGQAGNEPTDSYAKIGKAYEEAITDASDNIYQLKRFNYSDTKIGTTSTSSLIATTLTLDYDGNSDHKDKSIAYSYDTTNGSVLSQIEYGEVSGSSDGTFSDIGTDKRTTQFTYATNTSGVVALTKQSLLDNSSSTIAESKNYYDNQTFGLVTLGNRTKQLKLNSGTTYADTTWVYNSFGLPTSQTDPNGHVASYSYDPYNLYVSTTTNALSQSIFATYNYLSGKVSTTTNANGEVFATTYDGFGRTLTEVIPDPQTGSPVLLTQYAYIDTAGQVSEEKIRNLNTSTNNITYTYFDGFARPIQERVKAEDSNNYSVKDTVYDVKGAVKKQSLPYFSSNTSLTTATTNSYLYTQYVYDPLQRITSAITPLGTTLTNYDQWQTLGTDVLSHHKEFLNDAYGHLVQVNEHNGTSTYTTVYSWDGNNNLVKITDALGNIRNFTYDGLSRRTNIEDLHANGDATFGTRAFSYDAASNLASSTDANGNIVLYTYDNINRPLTENYQGATGTEITYGYDSCTRGVGLLCSVNNLNSATTTYTYSHTGTPASETKTIGGTSYTTSYQYDQLGNQTQVTYPDSSVVRNTYNNGNLLEKVEQKESGGSYRDIVSNFNYNPIGMVTYELFGNGASTTKIYDENELYRLRSIITSATNPTGGGGEELAKLANGAPLLGEETVKDTESATDSIKDPLQELSKSTSIAVIPLQVIQEVATDTIATSTDTPDETLLEVPVGYISKNIADITPRETHTTYQFSSEEKGKDYIVAEVSKDMPSVRFKKWNSTVDLGITYQAVTESAVYSSASNVTKWGNEKTSVEAYPLKAKEGMENGGFEIEVVLAETPASNIFNFSIDGTDNLNFFYQPPLTEEKLEAEVSSCTETECIDKEGKVIVRRPENIVGSYAIYSKNKKDGLYGTGKIGHIYRPQVTDAVGNKVWGNMSYQKGTLSVTLPQEFLDKAVYPVRVDPTFGYGTVGGTNAATWNYIGSNFSMNGENGTLTKITAYTRKDTAGTMNKIAALYSDSAGTPNSVLSTSSVTGGVGITAGWVDMIMPGYSVASGTTYWLFQGHDAASWVYWDTGSTNQYALKSLTYPAWESPMTSPTYFARIVSIYVTYNAAATNTAPTAPTSLLSEGVTNPTAVTDTTPEFSVIFNDANVSDTAASYQIQVSTSSAFISTKWDSGKTSLGSSTIQGTRIPDISYAGSALASSTSYYWRIKLWDNSDATGAWSTTTSTFILASSTTTGTSTSVVYPQFALFPQYLTYTYDSVGNITKIVDKSTTHSAATTTYTYDDINRLLTASTTQASTTPYKETYAYNAIGNLISKSDIGSYSYQGASGTLYANPHAPTLINSVIYSYDRNGNLASTSASTINTWNYRNRLASVLKNGTISTYVYGVSDERVSKTTGGVTTRYPSNLYEIAGATSTKHIYAGSDLLASVDGSGSTTSRIYFDHLDHLGSTAAVTNDIGYLNNLYTYYPFGGSRVEEGTGVSGTASTMSLPLYIDAVDGNWTNNSWSTTITNSTSTVYSGTQSLITIYTSAWGGMAYTRSLNTAQYSTLDFYVNVGATIPELDIYFLNASGTVIQNRLVSNYISGGLATSTWQHVSIPLSALGIANYNNTLTFTIESSLAQTVYYDQIQFLGTATSSSAGFSESNQFIGQNHDYETDLNYLNARYYDGARGQFTSQDPVFRAIGNSAEIQKLTKVDLSKVLMDPQALNSYNYARNNPIRYSDPEGLWFKEFATGQQSFSSFQVEVGQATQYMTDNSAAWNYAVSNPGKAGAVTGLVGGAAFLTGVPAVAAFSSSIVPVSGVGKVLVTNRLIEGSIYTYLAADSLSNLPNKLQGAANVRQGDLKSYGNFTGSFALDYGPGAFGEHADAIGNIIQLTQSLVSKLSNLVKQQKEQKNNNKK